MLSKVLLVEGGVGNELSYLIICHLWWSWRRKGKGRERGSMESERESERERELEG